MNKVIREIMKMFPGSDHDANLARGAALWGYAKGLEEFMTYRCMACNDPQNDAGTLVVYEGVDSSVCKPCSDLYPKA